MIHINLLPKEYEIAQQKKQQQILIGGAGAILAVFMILILTVQKSKASRLTEDIEKAKADLAAYQTINAQIEQIEADKQKMITKRDVIKDLNRSRLIYPVFFEDFLPLIPTDVWLTSLQFTEQGGQMKLSMNCNALSNFAVATWLTNLQQSPHFSAIELGAISYAKAGEQRISTLSFTLNCAYRHSGAFPLADM